MPKIFDRQFSGQYQPRRIDEDVWFENYQLALLQFANTDYGREFLHIDKNFPTITKIRKNFIQSTKDGVSLTEFHVGAKWANIIRYKWSQFVNDMYSLDIIFSFGFSSPVLALSLRGTTSTFYPDPNPETTTVDGRTYQQYGGGTGQVWATIRAAAGNGATDSGTGDEYASGLYSGPTSGLWNTVYRSIFLFDTSAIPDTDIISAATLSFYGFVGTINNFSQSIVPVSSNPASNTGLVSSDHSTLGSTAFATGISYGSWSTAGYNDFALNANGISNISQTGVSKFGLRCSGDQSNTEPTWAADTFAIGGCYYADETGTSKDPKLVVVHGAATSSINCMLTLGVG